MSRISDLTARVGVALAVALLLMAGCSKKAPNRSAQSSSVGASSTALPAATSVVSLPTTVAGQPAQTIRLVDADKGKTVGAHPGDTIVVSLVDCFSCGYHWAITTAPNGAVVAHRSTEDQPAQNPPGAVGASGKKVFTFQAVGAGTTGVSLGYFPPAKGAAPETTYALTFVVSG
jgi:predicted secreted protein